MAKKRVVHKRHKRGKGFIGDAWKAVKNIFRESPGEESTFSKYAKRGKKLLEDVGDITGNESIKKFSKRAGDIADTVGSYGKRGTALAEDVGLGRRKRRKRRTKRTKKGGMINPIASPGPILSMGYGSSGETHKRMHRMHGMGLSSKLVIL